MTSTPDDRERTLARLRASVVSRVLDVSGDKALADEVAEFVVLAVAGRVRELEADGAWESLEELAVRLAVGRRRARKQDVAVLLADVVSDSTSGRPPDAASLVTALETLPARERAVLELVHVEGLEPAEAAEFFGLGPRGLARLLSRARRRLRREHQRSTGGGLVVVGVLVEGIRRRRLAFGRLADEPVHTLAQWAASNPATALVATTAAAGVSLAVAVAAVVGPGGPAPGTSMARSGTTRALDGQHSPAVGAATVDGGERRAHEPSTAGGARPERGPVVIGQAVQRGPSGSQTSYSQEATAPVPPPPARPPDDNDGMLSHFTFFDCPPPAARAPVEDLACPVLEP